MKTVNKWSWLFNNLASDLLKSFNSTTILDHEGLKKKSNSSGWHYLPLFVIGWCNKCLGWNYFEIMTRQSSGWHDNRCWKLVFSTSVHNLNIIEFSSQPCVRPWFWVVSIKRLIIKASDKFQNQSGLVLSQTPRGRSRQKIHFLRDFRLVEQNLSWDLPVSKVTWLYLSDLSVIYPLTGRTF